MTEPELLLIAADGHTRALLLAELQEAGYNVVALPSLEVALAALATGRVNPALVLLDTQGDPRADPRGIGQLLNFLEEDIPLVLVVGAYDAYALAPLRARVAAWLPRPLRIADILTTVRRLLKKNHEDTKTRSS
jgi:DNA-binding NtrC family response regulator